MDALEKCQAEIKRLHKACQSKDVIITSACELIKEILDNLEDYNVLYPVTDEIKESFLKEVRYFENCKG